MKEKEGRRKGDSEKRRRREEMRKTRKRKETRREERRERNYTSMNPHPVCLSVRRCLCAYKCLNICLSVSVSITKFTYPEKINKITVKLLQRCNAQ